MSDMDQVVVKVSGVHRDTEGEETRIQMMAEGRHCLRGGKHYVLYDDHTIAQGEKVSTVLKFDEYRAMLLRHGAVEQSQEFLPQEESHSVYRTPFGNLDLSVRTDSLKVEFGSVSGTLDVEYDLLVDGEPNSRNSLHIEVLSASRGNNRLN